MSRLFSKISKNRGLWAAALVLAVLFVAAPRMAYAWPNLFKLDDIATDFVARFVFIVVWLLSMVAGVIIAIQAWFLQIVLSISFDLVNAAPVRIGFPIVLSMANLFFVGALIVIAIATIIRREEYGAKKILWKLVVMAVMVNFGLVICGALLKISDETAKFFIESISPASSGTDGKTNFKGFADTFAGAFNPAGVILSANDVQKNPALAEQDLSAFSTAGDDIGGAIKPIVSAISALGSFVIIIITLGALILMLLWRYIRLGMALIVLPLAWAAWIFPNYQEHYKKWWTKFTQWAIFPPVAIFFLWLGLKTSEVMSQQNGEYNALYNPEGSGAVGLFFGNLLKPIVAQTLKSFILFGIMMGGMVAAQELGVKFADAGYKAIEGAGGWAKGKAMHYSKRGARAAGQTVDRGIGKGLSKVGVEGTDKGISNWLAKSKSPFIAKGGRALQGLARRGGADIVTEAGKGLHADTDAERVDALEGGLELPEQLALLSKMDDLSKVKSIGGKSLADWLKKNHQKIEDYQQHGLEKKLKDMGATGFLDASRIEDEESRINAAKKAAKGSDPKMLAKLLKNGAGMGLEPTEAAALQATLMHGLSELSATQVADFTQKMDKEMIANFKQAISNAGVTSANADEILGPDATRYFRKNGQVRTRGMGAGDLWGENVPEGDIDPGTDGDIDTPDEPAPPPPQRSHDAPAHPEPAHPAPAHPEPAHPAPAPGTGDQGHAH